MNFLDLFSKQCELFNDSARIFRHCFWYKICSFNLFRIGKENFEDFLAKNRAIVRQMSFSLQNLTIVVKII